MNVPASLMAAEIDQAPAAIERSVIENGRALRAAAERALALDPAVVATNARGSSDHCALYLKYLIEIGLGIPCASLGPSLASLYQAPLKLDKALTLSISQSGRSPDIVEMQRAARRAGALTFALVNEETSPLATEPDCLLPLCAGPERSVAATKSVIAAMATGAMLIAEWRSDGEMAEAVQRLPALLRTQSEPLPIGVIETIAGAKSLFTLGRGATFSVAAEAALKLKETCGIHAEAFSAAEVLHGPAEIIASDFPVLAFMPQDEAREGMAATLDRIRGMGARVLAVDAGGESSDERLAVSAADHPQITPIAMIHRFYRLAEAVAQRLGRDPDNPRHLQKVTETL